MKRRALLALSGAAIAGLAGCSDALSLDSGGSADAMTVEQPGCPPYEADQIAKPSEEALAVNYEVSGSLSGDTDQWAETISVQNTGDSPVELTEYAVLFENGEQYTFDELRLIPRARVELITFGEPGTPTTTTCPKYDYTRRVALEEPLLQDRETRVTVMEPDGNHLFGTRIKVKE